MRKEYLSAADRACIAAVAAFPVPAWVNDPDTAYADSALSDESIIRGWYENWDHPSEFPAYDAWVPYLDALDGVREAVAESKSCGNCFRPAQQCFCYRQY